MWGSGPVDQDCPDKFKRQNPWLRPVIDTFPIGCQWLSRSGGHESQYDLGTKMRDYTDLQAVAVLFQSWDRKVVALSDGKNPQFPTTA